MQGESLFTTLFIKTSYKVCPTSAVDAGDNTHMHTAERRTNKHAGEGTARLQDLFYSPAAVGAHFSQAKLARNSAQVPRMCRCGHSTCRIVRSLDTHARSLDALVPHAGCTDATFCIRRAAFSLCPAACRPLLFVYHLLLRVGLSAC